MASTVSHDSHNLTVVYFNPEDGLAAAEELIRCGGGMTAVKDKTVLHTLPLEVAGLMTKFGGGGAFQKGFRHERGGTEAGTDGYGESAA